MLPAEAKSVLAESLARYRAGDLVGAFDGWPTNRAPQSSAERALHAALQLAIGDVAATQRELGALQSSAGVPPASGTSGAGGTPALLSGALQRVIAAVTLDPVVSRTPSTNSASALLA